MYAKLFAQIFDGTLTTKGPWQALVTFQQLLILADQEGTVDMTIGAIARRTTIPQEIIEKGISELLLPDPESRTPTEEGRRILPLSEGRSWGWRVVNYAHYRQLHREDDRREYHRQYWHKRKGSNSTDSTDSTDSTSTQLTQPNQPNQPIAYADTNAVIHADHAAKRPSATRSLLSVIPDDLFADFTKLRKAKKAPITQSAIDGIQREAVKAGIDLEEAIRICCERGWTGFKAEWHMLSGNNFPGTAKGTGTGTASAKPWEGAR